MKEPLYRLDLTVGINELLQLVDAVKWAYDNPEGHWAPQKQTVEKLQREKERIWDEYLQWRSRHAEALTRERSLAQLAVSKTSNGKP
jgi:hypothetical protein